MSLQEFSNESFTSKKYRKSTDQERSCKEKIRHKTEIKAAQAAVAYNRDVVIRNSDVQSYDCEHCSFWHIGHDNREQNRKKRAIMREAELAILSLLSPAYIGLTASKRAKSSQRRLRIGQSIAA